MPQPISFIERTLSRVRPFLSFKWYWMRKRLKDIIPKKTMPTRTSKPMNTIVLVLLGILIIVAFAYLASLFWMPLEDADFWLKVISGVVAALTFLAGAAALVTGHILGNRQAEKMLILDKDAAEARTKQAKAEAKLLELSEFRDKQVSPRWVYLTGLGDALKGKPTGRAEVIYVPDDDEAWITALVLTRELRAAGWQVIGPSVISEDEPNILIYPKEPGVPLLIRAGGQGPMHLLIKDDKTGPIAALVFALLRRVELGATPKKELPEDFVRVVVGPKS